MAVLCAPAQSAGGHHAVDDAAMLEPGQCLLETWLEHESSAARRLLQVGPSCRVGGVELGVNLDRTQSGNPTARGYTTALGLQLKWARSLTDDTSVGIVIAAARQQQAPHFAGGQLVLPLSWRIGSALTLHANLGRDFKRGAADSHRAGASIEWTPSDAWSFVAEQFRESGARYNRAALRYAPTPALSLDLGQVRGVHTGPGWWTLGVNLVFNP